MLPWDTRSAMSDEQDYLAYLLRLWRITSDGNLVWRASVESPHTGERHGFADLQVLFAFLEEQTRGQADPIALPGSPDEPGSAEAPSSGKR
jgi:hypothetical protein